MLKKRFLLLLLINIHLWGCRANTERAAGSRTHVVIDSFKLLSSGYDIFNDRFDTSGWNKTKVWAIFIDTLMTKIVIEQNGRYYSDSIYHLNDRKYFVQYYSDSVNMMEEHFAAVKYRSIKDTVIRFVFKEDTVLRLSAIDTIFSDYRWVRHHIKDNCRKNNVYREMEQLFEKAK